MSQFEFVMVLISIIVGIAITHLLLGVGGIIDRLAGKKEKLELSVAHAAWLVATFGWLILFWWWQFRLAVLVEEWTIQLYFFLVLYAVTLFLICVVLVPGSRDGVRSLKEYFLERRVWFYSLCLIGSFIDVADGYLKGGVEHIAGLGPFSWSNMIASTLVAILGIRIKNIVFHNVAAVTIMLWQYLIGFGVFPGWSSESNTWARVLFGRRYRKMDRVQSLLTRSENSSVNPGNWIRPLLGSKFACIGLLSLICLLGSSTAVAGSEPIVGQAVRHDTSPPIRDLVLLAKPVTGHEEAEPIRRRPDLGKSEANAEPDGGLQLEATGPDVIHSTPGPMLTVSGLSSQDNLATVGFQVVPPDSNGDIGLNEVGKRIFIQYINSVWGVFDAISGSRLYGPIAGNTFWTGFGGPCEANNDGDSLVLYDHLANRWVFSQYSIGEGTQCVAVSTTPDPLGPYYRYAFVVTPGGNNDYPKLGIWSDGTSSSTGQSGYILTTRDFGGAGGPFSMGNTVLERDAMLSGGAASFVKFSNPCEADDCLEGQLPPHLEGPAPPAGTCPTFWSAVDAAYDDSPYASDGYRNHTLCVNWSDPGSSTYTEGPFVTAGSNFDRFLGSGFGECISPVRESLDLDCLAAFTMYRAQYRWFGTDASVVLNTTVDAGDDRAGIRWAQIRSDSGDSDWALVQDGTYAPDDGLERWMGSIAQDRSGDIALGYSVAGAALYPSVRYTSRISGEPLGILGGGEASCHEGTGGATPLFNRWGDYSSMSVDPVDGCTFWYTQEYYPVTSSLDWETRICSFSLPECEPLQPEQPLDDRFYIRNEFTLPEVLTSGFGDLAFSDDGNTAFVIDRSNVAGAAIWSAPVIRGGIGNAVTGFGTFTKVFSYSFADTGLTFGPGTDTMLFRHSLAPGDIIQRFASGVTESTDIENYDGTYGGLAFVPDGYSHGGQLLSTSYYEGVIYQHDVVSDGDGSFTISGTAPLIAADLSSTKGTSVIGDIEFVEQGPLQGSLLVSGFAVIDEISYMPVDPITGLPDDGMVSTLFRSNDGDAWGLAVDPVTGNIWRVGYYTGRLTQIAPKGCDYAVVLPDGGESWNLNSVRAIRWQHAGPLCEPEVKIELLDGGMLQSVLSASTPNDGAFSWVIDGVPAGGNYTIRVTDLGDPDFADDSDASFSIVDEPGFIYSSSYE